MNHSNFIGRIVFDVEVKKVGEDKTVFNNRIAVANSKDDTTFIDVVAWGKTADLIGKYYKKGFEIAVSGKMVNGTRKKEIKKVTFEYQTTELLVERVHFTHGNPKEFNVDDVDVSFL